MLCGSKHRTPGVTLQPTTTQLPAIALRENAHEPGFDPPLPSARSPTPFNWGLSAVVNSCLIPRDLHRPPNFPPRNSPPPSDRTITTVEGTPSARVSARNCSNISAASDLWRIKHTHVYHEKSSRAMRVYRFLPRDSTTFGPQIHKSPPELLVCSCLRGLLDTFAATLRHGATSPLPKLYR